jgi:transposase
VDTAERVASPIAVFVPVQDPGCLLGAFYRRLQTRLGTPKAITATVHKLACIFYRLWSCGGSYDDPGVNYYEQRYQEQIAKGLRKKAQSFGFDLVAAPSTPIAS